MSRLLAGRRPTFKGSRIALQLGKRAGLMLALVGIVIGLPVLGRAADTMTAKERAKMTSPQAINAVANTVINGTNPSPLKTIYVGEDMSYQAYHRSIPGFGQFYPSGAASPADFGVFARFKGVLYAPNFGLHGGTATSGIGTNTPWTTITLSGLTGTGAAGNPFTVTSSGRAASAGLRLDLKTTYFNADEFFRHDMTFTNTGAGPDTFDVFLASDIYLAGSDNGIPQKTGTSVGGKDCGAGTYHVQHVPITAPSFYTARGFGTVWSEIGAGDLDNIVDTPCEDNGAGLEWKRQILQPGGSVTLQALTCFGTCAVATAKVGVNKDLKNTTGQIANDIEILLQGWYPTLLGHYDGYPANHFATFSVTQDPGGNTRLHWSNPNSPVQPGAIAHVGFLVPGPSVKIMGVFWTRDGVVTGCARQVNTNTHPFGGSTGQVLYENSCTSCESTSLYAGNLRVEWHAVEVPLDSLNATSVRTPIRTDIISSPPVLLAPNNQATVSLPSPTSNAAFAVISHQVSASSSLSGPDVTTDFIEVQVDAAPVITTPPGLPLTSAPSALLVLLGLALVTALALHRRRRQSA